MTPNPETKPQHSPLPWTVEEQTSDGRWRVVAMLSIIEPRRRDAVVHIGWQAGITDTDRANAALIVRAVNSHAELLAACQKLLAGCEAYLAANGHALQISGMLAARAAIAKAGGAL